jgi:hypothetical protein
MVLEGDELAAYLALGARWVKRMKPVGELEIVLLQRIIDASWRIDSAAALDSRIFAEQTAEIAAALDVDPSVAQAKAFQADCAGANTLLKITLYQSRLERALERSIQMFSEAQARRQAGRVAESIEDDADMHDALEWHRRFRELIVEPQPVELKAVSLLGSFVQLPVRSSADPSFPTACPVVSLPTAPAQPEIRSFGAPETTARPPTCHKFSNRTPR